MFIGVVEPPQQKNAIFQRKNFRKIFLKKIKIIKNKKNRI
jgi:hypothetical protein